MSLLIVGWGALLLLVLLLIPLGLDLLWTRALQGEPLASLFRFVAGLAVVAVFNLRLALVLNSA